MAELEAAAAAVTDELDAALGDVDRQLAAAAAGAGRGQRADGGQLAGLRRPADRGRASTPPPAAALLDPPAGLPAGLVPVGAQRAGERSGAPRSCPRQPTSLLVLPAETLAAVTAAMDALGLPYAPGTAGPESWDCGSLVQSVYGGGGHLAARRPRRSCSPSRRPVDAADVLPGDLVFLGNAGGRARARGHRAGPADDARRRRAGRRGRRPDPAGRPGAGHRPAEPGPARAGRRARARPAAPSRWSAATPSTRRATTGRAQWGGYPERADPAQRHVPARCGRRTRSGATPRRPTGRCRRPSPRPSARPICITDSYRTYASQVRLYGQKPALAAVPGTSNHGWGLAVDLCGGIEHFGTRAVHTG